MKVCRIRQRRTIRAFSIQRLPNKGAPLGVVAARRLRGEHRVLRSDEPPRIVFLRDNPTSDEKSNDEFLPIWESRRD
ncbi:hypothetical protein H483_0114545 [Dietzia sp. UCD-THP]|nr:hypothetical protein H483_0114545 [Dietzia sp. UCD-THP]